MQAPWNKKEVTYTFWEKCIWGSERRGEILSNESWTLNPLLSGSTYQGRRIIAYIKWEDGNGTWFFFLYWCFESKHVRALFFVWKFSCLDRTEFLMQYTIVWGSFHIYLVHVGILSHIIRFWWYELLNN